MADSVRGRRKRSNPLREQMVAARAANVDKRKLSEALGRRYEDVGELKGAIDDVLKAGGGSSAPKMDDVTGGRRGLRARFRALKRKVRG